MCIILFRFICLYFRFFYCCVALVQLNTTSVAQSVPYKRCRFIYSFIHLLFFFFAVFFRWSLYFFFHFLPVFACVCVESHKNEMKTKQSGTSTVVNVLAVPCLPACLHACMHAFWLAHLSCYDICACASGFCVHVQ